MIRAMDDLVIDRGYQPFADWVTDTFERDNFQTSIACFGIGFLLMLAEKVVGGFTGNILLTLLTLFVIMRIIGTLKMARELMLRTQAANPLRLYGLWMRWLMVAVAGYMCLFDLTLMRYGYPAVLALMDMAGMFLLVSGLFFAACMPKPPKPKEAELPADAVPEAG